MVGAYLGLTPRRDQSGDIDKQLPITKAGNGYLRKLLVGCAHYIIGPFGPECDLKRHGLKIAARGGKNARKRAAVAVARKLSVLLHGLWVNRQKYEPLHCSVKLNKAA
jgi:transposase